MEQRPFPADSDVFEVSDDFGDEFPIAAAELDAVEAFLMSFVGELLRQERWQAPLPDSETPQNPAYV